MSDTAQNSVAAQPRTEKGKGPARRLREKNLIPAVVYGLQAQPTPVAVDPAEVMKAIATPHKRNTLITLQLESGAKRVLFKDYQVDPVSRRLLHADFLEVALDKPVLVKVPVVTTGKAEGVLEGGILSVSTHEVTVEALPDRIPVQIEVDVTPIKIGHSLHVSELKSPEGSKIKYATDYVIAYVAVPEKEEVVAAPTAVAGAEGAAAPAAG
ncbi:MAG: 50S ribosomal protein L25/general stress protein Ctc, partial [Anaeromyxobacteraceae bacterium]